MLVPKKHTTLEKARSLYDHWPPEIMMVPSKCMDASALLKLQYALNRNICQIHCIYTIGCECFSEINTVFFESIYFCEMQKHCTLEKTDPCNKTRQNTKKKCFVGTTILDQDLCTSVNNCSSK